MLQTCYQQLGKCQWAEFFTSPLRNTGAGTVVLADILEAREGSDAAQVILRVAGDIYHAGVPPWWLPPQRRRKKGERSLVLRDMVGERCAVNREHRCRNAVLPPILALSVLPGVVSH